MSVKTIEAKEVEVDTKAEAVFPREVVEAVGVVATKEEAPGVIPYGGSESHQDRPVEVTQPTGFWRDGVGYTGYTA